MQYNKKLEISASILLRGKDQFWISVNNTGNLTENVRRRTIGARLSQ